MNALRALLLSAFLLACHDVHAGVTAERTRVIFNQGQAETSLRVVNQNAYPVVVQTWIDEGDPDASPESAEAPIIPLPPMFRLDPGQQRSLRLLWVGGNLPEDRESLYWLNLYEIPPAPAADGSEDAVRLTVTLRTQMKVIYRPRALARQADSAAAALSFRFSGGHLQVENPTPYFITLATVDPCPAEQAKGVPGVMLAPFSREHLPMPATPCRQPAGTVRFRWIDDDGVGRDGVARAGTGP